MTAGSDAAARELDRLLARAPGDVARSAREAFDRLAGPLGARLVLYGAGGLGRLTLAGLRRHGVEPVAFADAHAGGPGATRDGLPVLSPEEAAARYGRDACFVVTIWNPGQQFLAVQARLRELGCRSVASCVALFNKYPDTFLPYYGIGRPELIVADPARVARAFGLLADEPSRAEFVRVLRWTLDGDFEGARPRPAEEQYFAPELPPPSAADVFVDCGAFDGDSLAGFVARSGGLFRAAVAFEPDAANLQRLQARVDRLAPDVRARIAIQRAAVAAAAGRLSFASAGASTTVAAEGGDTVECVALDDVLATAPTYVKMDIEGMELEALRGAARTIRGAAPALAVCVYHRLEHLWEVPLAICDLHDGYRLLLRRYAELHFDCVCYALPRGRDGR